MVDQTRSTLVRFARGPVATAGGWAALVLVSVFLGALAVTSVKLLIVLLGAVALALLVMRPEWAAVGVLIALPAGLSVPGLPLKVGLSDLLVLVAITGWIVQDVLRPPEDVRPRAVRPLRVGLLLYAGAALLTVVLSPSGNAALALFQRGLIVLGPVLVGAGLVRTGKLRVALEGYLVACCGLAVAAVAESGADNILAVQKNPAGGYLTVGLILAVVLRPGRRWIGYAALLAVGSLATQSRGALLGLAAGAVVTVLVVRYRERRRLVLSFGAATGLLVLGYLTLPSAARERLLRASATDDFSVRYRQNYQADALDAFQAHPWFGEGVGNYNGGIRQPGISDPHQVLYLQLAEGGVVLLAAFVVLIGLSLWLALRHAVRSPLAVAALAVQLSTLVHALGDVYWVRGTPTMGFLLVGALVAAVDYAGRHDERGLEWLAARRRGLDTVAPLVPLAANGAARDGAAHRHA